MALLDPEGWPCEHEPPHGTALRKDGLYVVGHHHPDEGVVIAITGIGFKR